MSLHNEKGQSSSGHSEIYSQGYEKWDGVRDHFIPPWLLIGKTVLKNVVAPNGCLGRLIFIAFCVFLGIYYFFVVMSSFAHFQYENLKSSEAFSFFAAFLDQSGIDIQVMDLVKNFLLYQSLFFIPITMIFYGAQLISKDKAANALQVYFSKGISRLDYILGKLFAVGVLTSFTTLIPGAIIVLIGLFFNTNLKAYMQQAWYIPLVVICFWAMWTLVFGAITLVFSSMFNKSYMAAVAIIGFMGFCSVLALMLEQIVGQNGLVVGLDWFGSLRYIGNAMFELEAESKSMLIWRAIDLTGISVLAFAVVFRKINPVEVIK